MKVLQSILQSIINDMNLVIKFFIHNRTTMFMLILISLISILIPVILIPLSVAFPMVMEFSIISIVSLVFAITTYNFRFSTLYKNNHLTSNGSFVFYISKLIISVLLAISMAIIVIAVLAFLNLFSVLMYGVFGTQPDELNYYDFSLIPWLSFFIVVSELSVVTFSFSFFLKSIIKTQKGFIIIIILMLFLLIPFGGVVNNYFHPMNTYLGPKEKAMGFNTTAESTLPTWMFIPSLIFPFYSTGPLFGIMGQSIFMSANHVGEIPTPNNSMAYCNVFQWISKSSIDEWDSTLNEYVTNYLWQYKLVELMPLFDVLIFGSTGVFISKYNMKNNGLI